MAAIENLRLAFPDVSVERLNEALLRARGDPNKASALLLRPPSRSMTWGGSSGSTPAAPVPDLRTQPEAWFRHFDKAGSGGLRKQEVAEAVATTFTTIAPGVAREMVEGLWHLFDTDVSGSITLKEFTARDGLRDAIVAQMAAAGASSGGSSPSASAPVVQGILLDGPVPGGKGLVHPPAGKEGKGKGHGGKGGGHGRPAGGEARLPVEGRPVAAQGAAGPVVEGVLLEGKGPPPAPMKIQEGLPLKSKGVGKASVRARGDEAPAEPEREGPSFEEVLAALRPLHRRLGGTPHFGRNDPAIARKLKSSELAKSSNYEYVFMTILGFFELQTHGAEIIRLNNGAHWKHNPGTMRLEEVCGFTMHGDRPGVNGIIRTAPDALLQAFQLARRKNIVSEFFCGEAFDRTADPCLEGRLGRILAFLEAHGAGEASSPGGPPPSDLCPEDVPMDAPAERFVGEHLRVFRNKCIQRWAQAVDLPYERAKALWMAAEAGKPERGAPVPDVAKVCNAQNLLRYLVAEGLLAGQAGATAKARPAADVRRAVAFYVEMATLSP